MECEPDSLAKVIAEVFPKELIGNKQNETPSPRKSQTQNLQTLPSTMVSLSRVELQQAISPMLQQLTAIIDPLDLAEMLTTNPPVETQQGLQDQTVCQLKTK